MQVTKSLHAYSIRGGLHIPREHTPGARAATTGGKEAGLRKFCIQRNVRLGVLSEVLDAFADVCWVFKAAGADVTATCQYADKTFYHSFVRDSIRNANTDGICKPALDAKPFFEMHQSKWRAESLLDVEDSSRCD